MPHLIKSQGETINNLQGTLDMYHVQIQELEDNAVKLNREMHDLIANKQPDSQLTRNLLHTCIPATPHTKTTETPKEKATPEPHPDTSTETPKERTTPEPHPDTATETPKIDPPKPNTLIIGDSIIKDINENGLQNCKVQMSIKYHQPSGTMI